MYKKRQLDVGKGEKGIKDGPMVLSFGVWGDIDLNRGQEDGLG